MTGSIQNKIRPQHTTRTRQTNRPQQTNTGNTNSGATGDSAYVSRDVAAPPSERLGNLLSGLQDNFGQAQQSPLRGTGGDPVATEVADVYDRHGDQSHDLSDRGAVGRLISRSPQFDDMQDGRNRTTREASPGHRAERSRAETNNDAHRCGGAAVMNSLLLDGDFQNNGRALEAVANQRAEQREDFSVSREQRRALSHMREGNLTPRENAILQEMTYDMSHTGNQPGLSDQNMTGLLRDLRQNGAYNNTEEANFRLQDNNGADHWTVSTRTNQGVNHADSLPRPEGSGSGTGYATVTGADGANFDPPAEQGDYRGAVVFDRNEGGQELIRTRQQREGRVVEVHQNVSGGGGNTRPYVIARN